MEHPPADAHAAFLEVRAELDALTASDLRPLNVDIPTAAGIALAAVPRLALWRDRILRLPDFDIRSVDRLPTYALAAWFAHVRDLPTGERRLALEDAVARGRQLRDQLFEDAQPLVRAGLLDGVAVDSLRDKRGPREVAGQLVALGVMLEREYARIEGKSLVTPAIIQEAAQLGARIFGLASLDDDADAPRVGTRLDRVRGWTLLSRAYRQCRRGVAYWLSEDEDLESILPNFHAKRVGAR